MGTDTLAGLAAVFAGLGAGQGGFQASTQNIILEFGTREDLPMRIAMLNTATSFMNAVGPLLGGFIAHAISFTAVFWISILTLALSFVMMLFIAEPRHRHLFR
jgi:MFS family permease